MNAPFWASIFWSVTVVSGFAPMSPVAVNVNEPVNGGGVLVTVTVALALVVPPLPVQERV